MASSSVIFVLFALAIAPTTTAQSTHLVIAQLQPNSSSPWKANVTADAAAEATVEKKMASGDEVIAMLTDLQSQVTQEGTAEAEMYNKFASLCADSQKAKHAAITRGTDDKASLTTSIGELSSTHTGLDGRITTLEEDIAGLTEDISKAMYIRAKTHASYSTNEKDTSAAILALEKAIQSLKASKSPASASLVQLQSVARTVRTAMSMADALGLIRPEDKKVAAFFLQSMETEEMEEWKWRKVVQAQEVEMEDYKFHSGDIISTLEKLLKDLKDTKAELDKTEPQSVQDFQMLMQAKSDDMKAKEEALSTAKAERDQTIAFIARKSEQLSVTAATLLDDQKYLSKLNTLCAVKATWDQRDQAHADKFSPPTSVIGILGDSVKTKTSATTMRPTQQGPAKIIFGAHDSNNVVRNADAMNALVAEAPMRFLQRRQQRMFQPHSKMSGRDAVSATLKREGSFDEVVNTSSNLILRESAGTDFEDSVYASGTASSDLIMKSSSENSFYFIGKRNQSECPRGYGPIFSYNECYAAMKALGGSKFRGEKYRRSRKRLPFCWFLRGNYHFNPEGDRGNQKTVISRPICKQAVVSTIKPYKGCRGRWNRVRMGIKTKDNRASTCYQAVISNLKCSGTWFHRGKFCRCVMNGQKCEEYNTTANWRTYHVWSPYTQGTPGLKECPTGYEPILTEPECKAAQEAMGKFYYGTKYSNSWFRLPGCWIGNYGRGAGNFNTNLDTGSRKHKAVLLCKQANMCSCNSRGLIKSNKGDWCRLKGEDSQGTCLLLNGEQIYKWSWVRCANKKGEKLINCQATCRTHKCPKYYKKKVSDGPWSERNCCEATCKTMSCPSNMWTLNARSRSTSVSVDNCCMHIPFTRFENFCVDYAGARVDHGKRLIQYNTLEKCQRACVRAKKNCKAVEWYASNGGCAHHKEFIAKGSDGAQWMDAACFVKHQCQNDDHCFRGSMCVNNVCQLTCERYRCKTRGWTKRAGSEYDLNPYEERCCVPTCHSYTKKCPKTSETQWKGTICPSAPCSEDVCCKKTCAAYECPAGYIRNRANLYSADFFTRDHCCSATCAVYQCKTPGARKRCGVDEDKSGWALAYENVCCWNPTCKYFYDECPVFHHKITANTCHGCYCQESDCCVKLAGTYLTYFGGQYSTGNDLTRGADTTITCNDRITHTGYKCYNNKYVGHYQDQKETCNIDDVLRVDRPTTFWRDKLGWVCKFDIAEARQYLRQEPSFWVHVMDSVQYTGCDGGSDPNTYTHEFQCLRVDGNDLVGRFYETKSDCWGATRTVKSYYVKYQLRAKASCPASSKEKASVASADAAQAAIAKRHTAKPHGR